jgi:hypothetical protein
MNPPQERHRLLTKGDQLTLQSRWDNGEWQDKWTGNDSPDVRSLLLKGYGLEPSTDGEIRAKVSYRGDNGDIVKDARWFESVVDALAWVADHPAVKSGPTKITITSQEV